MKNVKLKIRIIILLLIISFLYFAGNSFASYVSSVVGGNNKDSSDKIQFARFVVNNTLSDSLNLDINNFNPGKSKDFGFIVSNSDYNRNNIKIYSDVSIKYRITISSFSLPLKYSLKKENETVNLTCNYNNNMTTCTSSEISLPYTNYSLQNYTLTVSYPIYNDNSDSFYMTYSNSIDIVSLSIDSWQSN